jgi:hypothetical protein
MWSKQKRQAQQACFLFDINASEGLALGMHSLT